MIYRDYLIRNGWQEKDGMWSHDNAFMKPCCEGDAVKIQTMLEKWDLEVEERHKERELRGCWTPSRVTCDCPACGGFND